MRYQKPLPGLCLNMGRLNREPKAFGLCPMLIKSRRLPGPNAPVRSDRCTFSADCKGNRASAARFETKELCDAFIKEAIILRLIDEPEASFTDNRLERSIRSSKIERKSNSMSGNKPITAIQVAVEGNAAETLHDSKYNPKPAGLLLSSSYRNSYTL